MINIIFASLIIIGICYSLITGNLENIGNIIIASADKTFSLAINIFAVTALWMGIINIASSSGLLTKFTKLLKPLFKKIFPEIPQGHESLDYITTNFVANMFGLGNAATPFGIKAMQSLKKLSNTNVASNSMITFLILNTAGFTIIPTTIISLRNNMSSNYSIVTITLISSLVSLVLALLINFIFRKVCK